MVFRTLLSLCKRRTGSMRRATPARRFSRRPQLECLEDRIQPSAVVMFTTAFPDQPNYLNFANTSIGTATLTNVTTSENYSLNEIDLPGGKSDFRVTDIETTGSGLVTGPVDPSLAGTALLTPGATLLPGQTITFQITFSPMTPRFQNDQLNVSSLSLGDTGASLYMDNNQASAIPINGQPGSYALSALNNNPFLYPLPKPIATTNPPPPPTPFVIWSLTGPTGSKAQIVYEQNPDPTHPTDAVPTFKPDLPGIYLAKLLVGNSVQGTVSTAEVTVVAGLAAVKLTPANTTVDQGQMVAYTAEGYANDPVTGLPTVDLGDVTPYTSFSISSGDNFIGNSNKLTPTTVGTWTVKGTVSTDSVSSDDVSGVATLAVMESAINGASVPLTPVNEGDLSPFPVVVATFTHANGIEPSTDFTATVSDSAGNTWGGVAISQNADGSYTVKSIRPQFSEEGTYTVSVGIGEDTASTTVSDTQTVTEPAIVGSSVALTAVYERDASDTVIVATFTHANGIEPSSAFTATVSDGTNTWSGVSISGPDSSGVYTVTATRPVFSEEGSYTVTVTIGETDGSPSSPITDSLTVNEPAINGSSATLALVNEGDPAATVTVATFTHANGIEPSSDFAATVSDGTYTWSGVSISGPDTSGVYTVSAMRPVYSEDGFNTVTVTIVEIGEFSASTSIMETLTVNEPPINGAGVPLMAVNEGDPAAKVVVATFTHANGIEPSTAFTAVVSDVSDGTIFPTFWSGVSISGPNSNGVYTVSATRPVFSVVGSKTVKVTIGETGGESPASTPVTDSLMVNAPIAPVINAPTVIRARATGPTFISMGTTKRSFQTISVSDSNPNATLDVILTVNYGTLWGLTLGLRGRLEVETGSEIELEGTQQQVNALLSGVLYTPPTIMPKVPIKLTIKATDLTTGITATTTVQIEVL